MHIRQLLLFKIRGESNRSISRLSGIYCNPINVYVHLQKVNPMKLLESQTTDRWQNCSQALARRIWIL